MRSIALSMLVIALALPAGSVMAADQSGKNYGNTICAQNVECPTRDGDQAAYVARAAVCAGRYFGFNADVFDSSRGVDYSGCVATRSSQTFGGSSIEMKPVCCYTPSDSGTCQLSCQVVTAR